jgi:hypothetical protein
MKRPNDSDLNRGIQIFWCPTCAAIGFLSETARDIHVRKKHPQPVKPKLLPAVPPRERLRRAVERARMEGLVVR